MTRRRDTRELLVLADLYLPTRRCLGNHIVHQNYVCPWCDSNNPSSVCFKEKVRTKEESPDDYLDEKVRRKVGKFEVVR